jgi:hypothetical protein
LNGTEISSNSWQAVYGRIACEVRRIISHTSVSTGVNGGDLEKQLLLHLPRFPHSQLLDGACITSEAQRLATQLSVRLEPFRYLCAQKGARLYPISDLKLQECSQEVARIIHERFHYLGSYHPGIVNLGLYVSGAQDFPLAMLSLAEMDIRRLAPHYPTTADRKTVLVVSRVYAFDSAPRNAISYLMGRTFAWLAEQLPEVRSLLTFLNPNLGFSGASLRASNWKTFIELNPVCAYRGDENLSYRRIANLDPLAREHIQYSSYSLAPLALLKYEMHRPRRRGRHGYSYSSPEL